MGKIFKKIFCAFSALLMLAAPPGMRGVYASGNTTLEITSSQFMEIDETNPNQINYYTDANKTTLAGSVQVKPATSSDSSDYLPLVMSGTTAIYDTGETEDTRVVVDLLPNSAANFRAPDTCNFGENLLSLLGTQFSLNLTGGLTNVLSFGFEENNGDNPSGHSGDMSGPPIFPIVAQFDVLGQSPIEVPTGEEGYIVIPDNWTSGMVDFKAKIFKSDGTIEPYTGQTSVGTIIEENLQIAGITNGNELNGTVTRNMDENFVMISKGFSDYGKLNVHVFGEPDSTSVISQIVTVVHKNLINIKADAPLAMSRSFGTFDVDQAIITKDEVKDVKIFFGNTQTTLIANGPAVQKITAVKGGLSGTLNDDGSATVVLPTLSTATTIPVEITMLKSDGSSIKRTVNIVRTALQLGHSYDHAKHAVYAGYVVHKGYLYNNQSHNDAIFNAYLQVILYKDNAVAGYKQIKIEDAELVNNLTNDEPGSMELYSDHQIAIYGENAGNFIDGVNKVSVFLTNGPIDFNGDTLPSVEFGIGSGVTCEWEALS